MTTERTRSLPAARGGFHRAFGLWEFIVAYLSAQGRVDDVDIDRPNDPSLGAPMTDIRSAYNLALTEEQAQRRAFEREERDARGTVGRGGRAAREARPLSEERVRELTARYAGHKTEEGFRKAVRGGKLSYNSFTVRMGELRRMGWVEVSGYREPSRFEDIRPGSPERKFLRLTAAGLAARGVTNAQRAYAAGGVIVQETESGVAMPDVPQETDPEEIRALNTRRRLRQLTTVEFEAAVEILTSGEVATAEEAVNRARVILARPEPSRAVARTARAAEPENMLETAWAVVKDRITGYARPNSSTAEKALDKFVADAVEKGATEDDLDDALSDVRSALEEYRDMDRGDYDSADEFSEARAAAWEAFTDALNDVDLPEQEEE
ncbi:MAG: hypothetical protein Q8R28_08070 [Dehalococcoidia bacterium]|nr:hypothetical protein [Dehalococcoidia bacterium]